MAATVGFWKNCWKVNSIPAARALASTVTKWMEFPPSAKKLSCTPMRSGSMPSTSPQTRTSSDSSRVPGA